MTKLEQLSERLLGSPYLECGRDPATGIDCLGLVIYVFREFGVELPDPISRDLDTVLNHRIMDSFDRVEDEPRDFDVVKTSERHLGIICGRNIFQSSERYGVIATRAGRMKPNARFRLKADLWPC